MHVATLWLLGMEFVFDALLAPAIVKTVITAQFSCVAVYYIVHAYFSYDDVLWNPLESFNFQHTEISFKNLYMSSLLNIVLFMSKPIFSKIARCVRDRGKIRSSNESGNNHSVKMNLERCALIHKRPHLLLKSTK